MVVLWGNIPSIHHFMLYVYIFVPGFCGCIIGKNYIIYGVPQNGWFIRENLIKMDNLGVPPFMETIINGIY